MHDRLRPEAAPETVALPTTKPSLPNRRWMEEPKRNLGTAFMFFGIVLPFAALLFELITRNCAATFFDPIPTWWHVALVALVPVANALAWWRLGSDSTKYDRWIPFGVAMALAVAAVYTVVFLPIMPFAIIGILFAGYGLLPLSPLFALGFLVKAGARLSRVVRMDKVLPGFAVGLVAVIAPSAWDRATDHLLDRAIHGDQVAQMSAVQRLRQVGRETRLLERCYQQPRSLSPLFGRAQWVSPEEFEKIRSTYYRVTGTPFNAQPAPASMQRGTGSGLLGRFNTDTGLGGLTVAGKVAGLTLETSQLETTVNAADLTSYTEWTLVFRNVAPMVNEARAQIELPPGGVVSRLTLWINDVPCEAAFGKVATVRGAYQQVAVVQQRDPVLVTTCGPDRVLMQCFPVPRDGGEMKVRLGITAPVQIARADSGSVAMPRMLETNFENGGALQAALVLHSDAGKEPTVRQELENAALDEGLHIPVHLPELAPRISDDPTDAQFAILQIPREVRAAAPQHVVYVIDGSVLLHAHRKSLREALAKPAAHTRAVFFAGDDVERWSGDEPLPDWIASRKFEGGRDNAPALRAAWMEAIQHEGSAIVWIHGPQPLALGETETLRTAFANRERRPVIYDVALGRGPNHILANVVNLPWQRVAPGHSVAARLEALGETWAGTRPTFVIERTRIAQSELPTEATRGTRHIARLWAKDEVERLQRGFSDAAAKLAVQMQLVTPVSGAVVLERQEQYDAHGLTPVDPETVPTIPEPASLLLLVGSGAALALRRRRPQR